MGVNFSPGGGGSVMGSPATAMMSGGGAMGKKLGAIGSGNPISMAMAAHPNSPMSTAASLGKSIYDMSNSAGPQDGGGAMDRRMQEMQANQGNTYGLGIQQTNSDPYNLMGVQQRRYGMAGGGY